MNKVRFEYIDKDTGEVWFRGVSVTRQHPCPVCGKPTSKAVGYCVIDQERQRVWCGHSPQDGREGTFYDLGSKQWTERPSNIIASVQNEPVDWSSVLRECEEDCTKMILHRHAKSLGVSVESLETLGAGWCAQYQGLSFPMYNASENVIGVRIRKEDGAKFAIPGSRNGLFLPSGSWSRETIVVVEGPSDTAAALDLDLPAIGRASAKTCVHELVEFCAWSHVVILANRDAPDKNGRMAGQEGAESLARCLNGRCLSLKVVLPIGAKDVRKWKQQGATTELVWSAINNARPWRP